MTWYIDRLVGRRRIERRIDTAADVALFVNRCFIYILLYTIVGSANIVYVESSDKAVIVLYVGAIFTSSCILESIAIYI